MADRVEVDAAWGVGYRSMRFNGKCILDCSVSEIMKASMVLYPVKYFEYWDGYHIRKDFVTNIIKQKE